MARRGKDAKRGGKHQKFAPKRGRQQRPRGGAASAAAQINERHAVFIIAAFAMLCLALLAYVHVDLTGHDYGYFLPKMLDTHAFYLKNGLLAWQEYTAALCAGLFQFANPQSMALALPQVLSYLFGPRFGIAATFVIASAMTGLGTYLCARLWGLGRMPAAIAAIALTFNGFLLTRLAVGHLAFYGFGFAPIIAASLLFGSAALRGGEIAKAAAYGCVTALLLALLIYGGIGVVIVHMLAVAALMVLICGGFSGAWIRAVVYCGLCVAGGVLAAAPKIEAVLAMNAQLPRDFYPLPGFNLSGLLGAWLQGLFWIPNEEAINAGFRNNQFYMGWHEIYYGFTPLILPLLVVGLILGRAKLPYRAAWRERPVMVVIVTLALLSAVAVNFYEPHWNRLLKSLPLIGQFSGMTRFFALFIPVVALLLGWSLGHVKRIPIAAVLGLVAALAFIQYLAIEANLRKGMYYDRVALRPVLEAWRVAENIPPTREVTIKTEGEAGGALQAVHAPYDDHQLIEGKSNALCYEPLFGYRLEQYQLRGLRIGAIDAVGADGNLNLKNPACYVYPQANQCMPGEHFKVEEREAMLALANRGDPGLVVSSRRQTANVVGIVVLSLLAGFLLLYAAAVWRVSRRRGGGVAA